MPAGFVVPCSVNPGIFKLMVTVFGYFVGGGAGRNGPRGKLALLGDAKARAKSTL